MLMPWQCQDCNYEWKDSIFYTYQSCPRCEGEFVEHGDTEEEPEDVTTE